MLSLHFVFLVEDYGRIRYHMNNHGKSTEHPTTYFNY